MSATAPTKAHRPAAPGDFWKLWAGQSTSLLGDSFMVVALPLFAVSVLHLSVAQAALTPFALNAPFLVLSLPAGALIDRRRRRAVLLACNAVQAGVFGLLVLIAWLHQLSFALLMLLLVISGCALVFFQVAYTTYLPSLISDPDELHRGNSRLYLSESASKTLGPVAAGPLVSLLGPLVTIAVNAGSFLVSFAAIKAIGHREPEPEATPVEREGMIREIREGLSFVLRHPWLEPVLSAGAIYVFFFSVLEASLVLYLHYTWGMSAGAIGLVLGLAGLGYPVGSLLSKRIMDRIGTSRALILSLVVNILGCVAMPVFGSVGWTVGLIAGGIMQAFGDAVFGPISLTLRQRVTPPGLLGRVNSVQRFLLWGMVPLGSLTASALISLDGLATALWTGGVGTALCLPALARRGVRRGWGTPAEAPHDAPGN
ncbi:MFS transporter [Streptomyces sp. NPDC002785]|uniref:MFS transporter n=1 Tax=Streptomyces sp. NPDC002785 TaxID=3154543 RepID=UPI003320307A